jgi:hypothetical protein
MERRLKQDVLTEAEENGKKLYTHEENESMEVNPVWCDVSSVQTPREVFTELLSQLKVELKYTRLPITTEQPPEIKVRKLGTTTTNSHQDLTPNEISS